MQDYKLSASFIEACQFIKSKGFSHIKFELEADLYRDHEESSYCDNCNEGHVTCWNCNGRGLVFETIDGEEQREICDDCAGEGVTTCDDCGGEWENYSSGGWSNGDCLAEIRSNISDEARQALTYIEVYVDGSVDTECTFTLPIEKAHLAMELVQAMNRLADEIGHGMETSGAGMHITLMSDGDYHRACQQRLDRERLANFQREMHKLLPALYFLATPDHTTRPLGYRTPEVQRDGYAAIRVNEGAMLEYRIFDTCYQKPEQIFDNVEVIANTLKYYAPKHQTQAKTKTMRLASYVNNIAKLFDTPEKLDALNEGLRFLKPKAKSVNQLKQERSFKVTRKSLDLEIAKQRVRYARDYEHYLKVDLPERIDNQFQGFNARLNRRFENTTEANYDWPEDIKELYVFYKIRQAGGEAALKQILIDNGKLDATPIGFDQYVEDHRRSEQPFTLNQLTTEGV